MRDDPVSLKRCIAGILAVSLAVACGGGGGGGGGGSGGRTAGPDASVVATLAFSGSETLLTLSVVDRRSRAVDLLVEYSLDGGGAWAPASQKPGEAPLTGVPATPQGAEASFTWSSFLDLAGGHFDSVLVRATPVSPEGSGRPSEAFELYSYGEPKIGDLRDEIYPDLQADGDLDALVLIDTRDPGDYAFAAVPGAISITLSEILENGEAALPWPKSTRIVFYCNGGT